MGVGGVRGTGTLEGKRRAALACAAPCANA